jgi:flagellar hook-basal body complex protein FliE
MRIAAVPSQFQKTIEGGVKGSTGPAAASFSEELKSKIQDVNQLQNQAESAMQAESVSGATNIHETMLKLEEADISMRLMTKVRNKALDAYHEMMRMQF